MGDALVVYDQQFSNYQRARRASQAEKELRITLIVDMYNHGRNDMDVRAFARKNWGLSDGQSRRYIEWAKAWIRKATEKNRDQIQALGETRRERLYEMSLLLIPQEGIRAVNAALEILKDLARYQRVYDGERFSKKSDEESEADRASRDLADKLSELAERIRQRATGGSSPSPERNGAAPDHSGNGQAH